MLTFKRPGTGISPKFLEKVIGKKAKRDIGKDKVIEWKDLGGFLILDTPKILNKSNLE
jgi:sialic acid synthase SpsE